MTFLINFLLIIITLLPKITIISVSNTTTGIRMEDLLLFICTCLLLLYHLKHRNNIKNRQFNKIKFAMYLYLAFSAISSLYGVLKGYVSPTTSILFSVRRLEYFLMFYFGYYYTMRKPYNNGKYIDFIVLFHTLICLLQLFGVVGSFNHGEMISALTQGRISSTFNGAYEMSAFLLLLLPYYFNNLLNQKKSIKNALFVILITFCIVISASRTSLILECVVIVYMLIKSGIFKNKKVMQKIVILSLFFILPALVFFVSKMNFTRYINLSYQKTEYIVRYAWSNRNFSKYVKTRSWYGNSYYTISQIAAMGYDDSLYVRVSHWMQLMDGWISSPLIGTGVSIAGTACDGNYVKILSETGIIGLGLWIYLLYAIKKCLKNSRWLKYSFITIVLGALLIDLFDASKIMMFFWFLLGLYVNKGDDMSYQTEMEVKEK